MKGVSWWERKGNDLGLRVKVARDPGTFTPNVGMQVPVCPLTAEIIEVQGLTQLSYS